MTMKQKIINRAIEHALSLLSAKYSQENRLQFYQGGSFDCSSYAFSNFAFAGYPLVDKNGAELITSNIQVDAVGFNLLYPAKYTDIGKKLPSDANLITSYGAEPGDLIFYNFGETTRKNKITHVAMVLDKDHIIHTANTRENCCVKPITYGQKNICAITRLAYDVSVPNLPTIKQGTENIKWARVLQIILNMEGMAPKFGCSGAYGPKTDAAVRSFQQHRGLEVDGIVGPKTWAALLKYEETAEAVTNNAELDAFKKENAALKKAVSDISAVCNSVI